MTQNKSLYEIAARYEQALIKLTDADLPEEVVQDTLEGIEGEIEEKAVNVAKFIGNLESQAKQIDEAVKAMKARQTSLKNRSARIKTYLHDNMEKSGITAISCPYFDIKIKKNPPSVIIEDEALIPSEFTDTKTVVTINKTAIKKAGGCPGATLQSSTRVEIK